MILPSPAAPFEWIETEGGPGLVCRPLERFAPHLFTTRHWRLGRLGMRGLESDAERWKDVAVALKVDRSQLVTVRQVHGAEIALARRDFAAGQDEDIADIIVSDDPSLALAIRVADCVPVLIADRRTGAAAAAHAGWRGLAARAPEAAVAALARTFHSRPADLLAAIGPAIGACCYEVGVDVREAFARAGFGAGHLERWFLAAPSPTARNPSMPQRITTSRERHWHFDVWAVAIEQLASAGVPADQIFASDMCTASHPDAFCSYRRDGATAGRMAAAIRPCYP